MMDDPDQGTYTFTGAQLKEQRRQWMDEGRRSALAEQALIEDSVQIPPCPFKVGDYVVNRHHAPHCDVLDVRRVTDTYYDTDFEYWQLSFNAQPAKDGYYAPAFVALSDYKPSLREGIDFYV